MCCQNKLITFLQSWNQLKSANRRYSHLQMITRKVGWKSQLKLFSGDGKSNLGSQSSRCNLYALMLECERVVFVVGPFLR
mmetsp:Transcript_17093/g.30945  ORF Transcript_17093/g.30945 Transcript_17093/m.30945 type:complete len:80 (-) Transcript_17093:93-332(-)